jgi:hypothetical protein
MASLTSLIDSEMIVERWICHYSADEVESVSNKDKAYLSRLAT